MSANETQRIVPNRPDLSMGGLKRLCELMDGYLWGVDTASPGLKAVDLIAAGAGVRTLFDGSSYHSDVCFIELSKGVAISMAVHRVIEPDVFKSEMLYMDVAKDMLIIRLPVMGELRVEYDGNQLVEAPHVVTLSRINPGIRYASSFQYTGHFSSVLIQIQPESLLPFIGLDETAGQSYSRFYPQSRLAMSEVREFSMNPAIVALVEQIFNPTLVGGELLVFLRAQTQLLLTQMLTDYGRPTDHQADAFSNQQLRALFRAKELLLANVSNPPALTELAQQVGLNRNILNKGFREQFGTTVAQFAKEARLQQAWMLLQTTDLPVTEVADQVGYSYVNNLIAAFRKRFAVSPKQARLHPDGVRLLN